MEHLDPEHKEVYELIKGKNGCTYEYVYEKTNYEKKDLSLIIYRLTQLSLIFKQDKSYFTSNVSDEEMAKYNYDKAKEAADKISAAVSKRQVKEIEKQESKLPVAAVSSVSGEPAANMPVVIKPVVPAVPEKIYGNLNRGSNSGIIAFFFYKKRKENTAYNAANIVKELEFILGADAKKIKQTIYSLAYAGVIKVVNPDEYSKFYKWADYLIYPFSEVLPTDDALLLDKSKPVAKTEEAIVTMATTDKSTHIADTEKPSPMLYLHSEKGPREPQIETVHSSESVKNDLEEPVGGTINSFISADEELDTKIIDNGNVIRDSINAHIELLSLKISSLVKLRNALSST